MIVALLSPEVREASSMYTLKVKNAKKQGVLMNMISSRGLLLPLAGVFAHRTGHHDGSTHGLCSTL